MFQMVLPNQGGMKEIFPPIQKGTSQMQEGQPLPFQNESFKKVLARVNQSSEEQKEISSPVNQDNEKQNEVSSAGDFPPNHAQQTTHDEHGGINGGLVNGPENIAFGDNQEMVLSLANAGSENTPKHEAPAAVSREKETAEPVRLQENGNRILPHPHMQKGGKEEGDPLQVKISEGENPKAAAEEITPLIKGEKKEIKLPNMVTAMSKEGEAQQAASGPKGHGAGEAVILAGNMKKGAELGEPLIKDVAFKKTGEAQVAALSSAGADADTAKNSQTANSKQPPMANPSPTLQGSQGKFPFAVALDGLQTAETVGDEELIVHSRESVPQGSAFRGTAGQVYGSDRVMPRGVTVPMEQIVREAGSILEKGGKVQLILHPPNLGKINMEVVVRNNRVELMMTVGNTDVQQVLQASSDQLRSALQNQGLQFDQMSVLLKKDNSGFDLGGQPLWQNGQREGEKQGRAQGLVPEEMLAEPAGMRHDETGNISIFV